jgi:hypothetical protein
MTRVAEINKQNLRELAWRAGYRGVTDLAKAVGRNRCVIHHAVDNPRRYGPTMKKLREVLL